MSVVTRFDKALQSHFAHDAWINPAAPRLLRLLDSLPALAAASIAIGFYSCLGLVDFCSSSHVTLAWKNSRWPVPDN
jgi:hypothetical protein